MVYTSTAPCTEKRPQNECSFRGSGFVHRKQVSSCLIGTNDAAPSSLFQICLFTYTGARDIYVLLDAYIPATLEATMVPLIGGMSYALSARFPVTVRFACVIPEVKLFLSPFTATLLVRWNFEVVATARSSGVCYRWAASTIYCKIGIWK